MIDSKHDGTLQRRRVIRLLQKSGILLALFFVMGSSVPVQASTRGYEMWFFGEIVGINARHGTILISRGPTETAGPAVVKCLLPHRAMRHIREGMQVDAEADTRTTPWRIIHLRVLHTFTKTARWTS